MHSSVMRSDRNCWPGYPWPVGLSRKSPTDSAIDSDRGLYLCLSLQAPARTSTWQARFAFRGSCTRNMNSFCHHQPCAITVCQWTISNRNWKQNCLQAPTNIVRRRLDVSLWFWLRYKNVEVTGHFGSKTFRLHCRRVPKTLRPLRCVIALWYLNLLHVSSVADACLFILNGDQKQMPL